MMLPPAGPKCRTAAFEASSTPSTAPRPTALLLGARAGCVVVFIRDTLAPQLGVQVESVEATAR